CTLSFTSATYYIQENSATATAIIPFGDITSDFPEGAAGTAFIIASVSAPGPATLFDIVGTTGVLMVGSTIPDFETHGGNTYTVDMQCKQTTGVDGSSVSVDVTFTNEVELCTMSWSGGPFSVAENTATRTEIIAASSLTSTFPETADTTAFSITSVSPGATTLFDIDPSTGALSVGSTPPDYENDASTQTITVTCHQSSTTSAAETVVVTITNVDEDCTINWPSAPFVVAENSVTTTVVIASSAITGVFPENAAANPYDITSVSPGPAGLFAINQATGAISVDSVVPDYETHTTSQTITVTCYQASGHNVAYTVDVNIENVDEACTLLFTSVTYSIQENSATATAIIPFGDITSDFPEGAAGTGFIIASVSAPGPATLFDIDGSTSVLMVGSTIPDFETHGGNTYTVDMQCKQTTGVDGSSVSVDVTFTNEVELCTMSWSGGPFSVAENTATGTEIIAASSLTSTFPETADTPAFSITSVSPGATTLFDIDPSTGALSVGSTPPDFESEASLQTVTVTCHQMSGEDNTATVTVTILDVVEDCTIAWSSPQYAISENSVTTTVIIDTTDFTPDFPETAAAVTVYSIAGVSPGPTNLFTIDQSTGAISIDSEIPDYEFHTTTQTVTVTCYQASGNNNDQTIDIVIENVDEPCTLSFANAPYSIDENSATGTTITPFSDITSDFPEGEATPSFIIVGVSAPGPSTLFDIDGTTGVIQIGSTVPDYETHGGNTYSVEIQCKQTSGVDASVTIDITFDDVIELCTVGWTGTPYTVLENTNTGEIIIDSSELVTSFPEGAATPAFSISVSPGAATLFSIDGTTGALMVGTTPPDYEADNTIQTVTVSCLQDSSQDNTNDVTVTIVNVLEACSIQWVNAPYSIDENSNTAVNVVPAADVMGDFPEGASSPSYGISSVDPGPAELFSIDATSGAIVIGSLSPNFELHGSTTQTIYVDCMQDSGPDDTYAVSVQINDIDETPQFANLPTSIKISESIGASQSVFKVFYNDPEGVAVTVDISTQTPVTPAFTVVNGNEIHSPVGLDYDLSDRTYTLTIRVDDGTNTDTSTLTINLYNEIDEPPTFPASDYTGTIEEEQSYGTVVTWTTNPVADMIASYNEVGDSNLYYELSGTNSVDFNCDRLTGVITTSRKLDADDVSSTASYSLTLTVGDSAGHTDTTTLSITLTDINDNKPIFSPSLYYKAIDENSGAGVIAATMTVSDDDAGVFGTVTLTITSGVTAKFTLSGNEILTTADPLDYETTTSYTITVTAADGGGEISTATVIVDVGKLNEFPPIFDTFPATAITVAENSALGFEVLAAADIIASDDDDGLDGKISFSISAVTNGGINKFSMDSSTGRILTTSTFDYESGSISYIITCVAADQGSPGPSSTTRSLTVDISDENDNAPYFDQNYYSLTITEGDVIDTVITTFNVNDDDSAAITTISYQFYSGNDLDKFKMDDATHQLKIKTLVNLDAGHPDVYDIVLRVLDGGTPELTGTTSLHISVTETNDYDPVFGTTTPIAISISENTNLGSTVAVINVSDDDYGSSGDVTLTITGGDTENNFRLDDGNLVVKKSIKYEDTGSPIVLTIEATDDGATPRVVSEDISIAVTNENNYKPTCSPRNYATTVPETAAASDPVAQIECQDIDLDTLTYTITAGNGDSNFEVDGTGLVTVASSGSIIDYESGILKYSLTVEVSDGANTLDVQVTANIEAVNEDSPVFDTGAWTVNLDEDTSSQDIIVSLASSITDTDTGGHGIVAYKITSVSPTSGTSKFSIDERSGEIFLFESLDYEEETSYDIAVEAEDGGGLTDAAIITINVIDLNDNSPSCLQTSYSVNVNEHTYTYTAVSMADLGCTDIDSGTLGDCGIADTLDYEADRQYTMTLRVSDGGTTPPQTQDIAISVTVDAIDEGAPVFAGPYSTSVLEDAEPGTTIETCIAIDPDSDDTLHGQVSYAITNGNTAEHFAIDSSTGVVQTIDLLDRETIDSYTLEITATDGNGGTGVETLDITVTDVNDVEPSCTQYSYALDLDEDTPVGTLFSLVCTDDDPADSTLTYTLTSGDALMFGVNTVGDVYLQSALDYDGVNSNRSYRFEITVSDVASHSVVIEGSVYVLPVNEDSPAFTTGLYSQDVDEDVAIGSTLLTVLAIDTDSSDTTDGVVVYTIGDACSCPEFHMNRHTGDITLLTLLDYETTTSYTLPIEATDGSTTDFAIIEIHVIDVNDNAPVFLPVSYSEIVQEELPAGQVVATVNVTDIDSITDDNNVILLYIASGTAFSVDSATGEITTTGLIDYETIQLFNLEVVAEDRNGASGANSATALVTIDIEPVNEYTPVFQSTSYNISISEFTATGVTVLTISATDDDLASHPHDSTAALGDQLSTDVDVEIIIEDENDNTPTCDPQPYVVSISENESTGTTVTTLVIQDSDSGTNGEVAITKASGDENNDFVLTNYDLILDQQLIYHVTPVYDIVFNVTDRGSPSLSTNCAVTVNVLPENNYTPVFGIDPDNIVISESLEIGSVIYTAIATDEDAIGSDGKVTYNITEGNSEEKFTVDLYSGDVLTKSLLDREITDQYILEITATDGGDTPLTGTVTLSITVEDVNDNTPIFSQDIYTTSILENINIGTSVFTVIATDIDSGANSNIEYNITGGMSHEDFNIDIATGEITTAADIDFETRKMYSLTVQATDGGTPVRSSDTVVRIKINDYNDNVPVIFPNGVTISIFENSPSDTLVIPQWVVDEDSDENGNVTFLLADGDPLGQFYIDNWSGLIYTSNFGPILDREVQDTYHLLVNASDLGTPSLASTSTVTIVIVDENDNSPVIVNPGSYDTTISEDQHVGTSVLTIIATDDDANENGQLTYDITSGNDGTFALASTSGVLSVVMPLDRETTASYSLEVTVTDNGLVPLFAQTTFTITIADINDNVPQFAQSVLKLYVAENVPLSTLVDTLLATDPDLGDNGLVNYTISSGVNADHFILDIETGVLITAADIDRELIGSYLFTCKAVDNGSPTLFTSVTVEIIVEDENDNYPIFNEDEYSVTIAEDHDVNAYILTVDATDADNGTNAELTYSFHSSFPVGDEYFSIDDNGSPVLTTTTTVYVYLIDVNDNAPKFNPTFYSAEVAADNVAGETIVTVTATDAEDGETVKYVLTMDESQQFVIGSSTGDITLIEEQTLQAGEKYELRVEAEDYGLPQLTSSDEAVVRIDAFDPSICLIKFYISNSLVDFTLTKSDFLQAITNIIHDYFPTARCGISHITVQDGGTTLSTRKLLVDDEQIIVYLYAVADNSTDVKDGLNLAKDFVLASYMYDLFAQDSSGTPSDELQSGVFEQWDITMVDYDSRPGEWYQLWWGILLIVLACLSFVIACFCITLCVYWFCCAKKKDKKLNDKDKAKPTIIPRSFAQRSAWLPGSDKEKRVADPTLSVLALPSARSNTVQTTRKNHTARPDYTVTPVETNKPRYGGSQLDAF
uniref:Protocadherin Fat 4-like n=1 Tax=Saccoglossus kowalevskii TaxID=10224 RepID=A0ABM0N157_SACKO